MQQVGIEAGTSGIKVLLASFGLFPSVANKLLVSHGVIAPGADGKLAVQERWFALDTWLDVHEAIRKEIGPNALFTLGTRIMENPKFPPWIRDIETALESMDATYHSSHRKNGIVMFDPTTSIMLDGIGHYRPRRAAGAKRIEVVCDTPYQCEVDFGIVTVVAARFEAKARTEHGPGACRRTGASSCTYVVRW